MIEIKNLSMAYYEKPILKDINLKLDRGKIYGLFGRNGVGKTTLLKILSNQIVSYKGKISYEGEKITENRKSLEHICYVSSDDNLGYFQNYSLNNLLKNNAMLYVNFDLDYALKLLTEEFNINPYRKYKQLSKGNKVIFNLIVGLAANCDFTIFDEPSSGLDAINRTKFYKVFSEVFDNENKTAIIATHIIDEIEHYITDILILKKAEIVFNDTIENFEEKSFIITSDTESVPNLNIIGEESLGSMKIYYVYDEVSEDIKREFTTSGFKISKLDLQKFFIEMVEAKENKDEK
ncbi:ABC-2 type transport system ATP-binding protein [Anaerosphaera aminiphila DSM 21120]|uniref:ABC-2 type transport system ATP-binding protein n=1 Tax=Anaerosphaera aminiphila DSM 21120 TaxID=1120995 RepID=A0A1M5QMD5_9FIRM|nr:ABC transporter ATP-binding protein [Anaerosphaera aminiphila]SHH14981.1 ABC-2 type transport system ATP-binding protein [Anaerosphaera aminiphila DSM 21120]